MTTGKDLDGVATLGRFRTTFHSAVCLRGIYDFKLNQPIFDHIFALSSPFLAFHCRLKFHAARPLSIFNNFFFFFFFFFLLDHLTMTAEKRKRDNGDTKSVLLSEDGAFPRGGASALTPLEMKQVSNEATKDVLFESTNASESKRKPKKKSKANAKKQAKDDESKVTKKTKIESLSFGRLVPGSLVLGQVSQVNSFDLALSLPNNLTGYIPITNISQQLTSKIISEENESVDGDNDDDNEDGDEVPELSNLFKVGQWLRAVVTHSGAEEPKSKNQKPKKRIELSIEPDRVNASIDSQDLQPGMAIQVAVNSVEDHGVVFGLGIDTEKTGFISKKELHHAGISTNSLVPGQVMLLTILSKAANGRTYTLTASPLAKKLPTLTSLASTESLNAGILVDAEITEVRDSGLFAKVFEFAVGSVDLIHSGVYENDKLSSKFNKGDHIKARIIATLPSIDGDSPRVALSLLSTVVGLTNVSTSPLEALPIGSVEDAEIKHVEPSVGLIVRVKNALGFVHISRISSEERIEELSATDGDYTPESVHKARVLGYSYADSMYILSMEKAVIEQPYIRVEDIPVGEVISGRVDYIVPKGGVVIKIADGISAVANENHLSDIKLMHPEKMYRPNMKVKARVLNVDVDRHKVYVTLKKSLVNTQDELLTKFSDAKVGLKTPGTIISIKPKGAIVEFFGGIKAFLPVSEISEVFVKNPKDHLKIGQSVSVRITDVDPEDERLTVSCRASSSTSEQKEALENLVPGRSIVSASVVEKTKDGLVVEVEPADLRGVISIGHLSDGNMIQNRGLLKNLKVGSSIDNLVVLEKDVKKAFVTLSGKKSLVNDASAGILPMSFEEVTVDESTELHGFVKNATIKGVFVGFANNLTGLALKQDLSNEFVEDPQKLFVPFQSVTCRVINVNQAEQRFQLSLKPKSATANDKKEAPASAAVNPVDSSVNSVAEYIPGKITKARINNVKDSQLNIQLADNVQGRVDVSQVFDKFDDIKDPKRPLKSTFKKGDVVDVKIIGYHDARNHRFLPISHRTSTHTILECSTKKSDVTTGSSHQILSSKDIELGSEWTAFVNNFTPDFLWINLSPTVRGKIYLLDLTENMHTIVNVEDVHPIGSAIKVKVIENTTDVLKLSARELEGTAINSFEDVKMDTIIPALVAKVTDNTVVVRLNSAGKVFATASLTDIFDEYDEAEAMTAEFVPRELVSARVVGVDKSNKRVHVSLRPSQNDDDSTVVDKFVGSIDDVKTGDVIRGFVRNVADSGLFVSLGHNVTARVQIKNLSDAYLSNWKNYFKVNQLVKGKIISVEKKKIEMTLKESAISGKKSDKNLSIADIEEGSILDGTVKTIEEFGIFVRIDGSSVSGLCHRSEVADVPLNDLSKVFSEGDRVKVKVLSVDPEKKRVSLGMKASYFGDYDSDVDMEGSDDGSDESDDEMVLDNLNDAEDDDEDSSEDESEEEEEQTTKQAALSTGGGLSAGFDWTASILDQTKDFGSDSESEDEEPERKRRKKKSKAVEDKTAELSTKLPDSVADYERLLVGSPNSSIIWMNYMAFQLQLSEVDKAREIGERALKTINFREEQEKFNVWIALLNLENSFGTPESLETVFRRAVQHNDPKTIHMKLLAIYTQSGKFEEAEKLYQTTTKKFGSKDLNVYISFANFLFDREKHAKARELLGRSLQALEKGDHRDMITKFAQVEYEKGELEQGRTLFEGLVSSYPKRADLWNIYLDQEIKHGKDRKIVEDLFERIISGTTVKLSMKRAKFFFKKWLNYESEAGDEKAQDYVKAKAAEYVASKTKEDDE
uniref:ARAD1D43010p n=1 Tax=Blastobotrys adeninivorans TaxID=409370 RepID=A0A060TDE1_BLAAD